MDGGTEVGAKVLFQEIDLFEQGCVDCFLTQALEVFL